MTNRNIAVFFHYFEANEIYKENLIFFLSTAYRTDIDFFIIISGESTILFPTINNVKYIHTENKNNDFGGYAFALGKLKDTCSYDYYIFINSSVRGPFLKPNYKGNWTDLFVTKFSDDVHLVGSSINVIPSKSTHFQNFGKIFNYDKPYSHIQTTAYALSRAAINHLLSIGFYSENDYLSKDDVICKYEIRLSQEIKRNGWNFKCFLSKYNSIDYRENHTDPNKSSVNGDPLYLGAYFGRTARPYELVFVKTNRNLFTTSRLYLYTYISLVLATRKTHNKWIEYYSLKNKTVSDLNKSVKDSLKNKAINFIKKLRNYSGRAE